LLFRPTAVNLALISSRVSKGDGRERFARARFAVVPSLLPSGTAHEGPPAYNHT